MVTPFIIIPAAIFGIVETVKDLYDASW